MIRRPLLILVALLFLVVAPAIAQPSIPQGLVVGATGSISIQLLWSASTGVISNYRVERCSPAFCVNFAEIAQPATTSYVDSSLSASTLYRYRVRAFTGSQFSGYSDVQEATTSAVRTITAAWTDNATTETGFHLRRCVTTSASCAPSSVYATPGINAVSSVDASGHTPVSCYDLSAFNSFGDSSFTAVACKAPPASVLLAAPHAMTFTAATGGANPSTQSLQLVNGVPTTMPWTISSNAPWLSASPTSGTNTVLLTVTAATGSLTAATYLGQLTIAAPGATGTPTVVDVTFQVVAVTAPSSQRGGRFR